MAKIIKITDELLNEMRSEFEKALATDKMSNGKFKFEKSFDKIERKAVIRFQESAYIKMQALINKFDKEVGWNGLVKRVEGEENAFEIYDILVYPQTVTGATVKTDPVEEVQWEDSLSDEQFEALKFHGHSHVNMGVSPSSTDESMYKDILGEINGNMFYIFMILNKKGDYMARIYDLKENVLYETDDIEIEIIKSEDSLWDFLENAETLVKTETYSYQKACANKTESGASNKKDNKTRKKKSAKRYIPDNSGYIDAFEEGEEYECGLEAGYRGYYGSRYCW